MSCALAHRTHLEKRDSLVWIETRGGGRRSEVRRGGTSFRDRDVDCGCLGGTLGETAVVRYIISIMHSDMLAPLVTR
jgi:hypothetical protein